MKRKKKFVEYYYVCKTEYTYIYIYYNTSCIDLLTVHYHWVISILLNEKSLDGVLPIII